MRAWPFATLLLCVGTLSLTAAEKPWSAWIGVEGDDAIQFRWQLETFGSMSPNCNIEVRNTFATVTAVIARVDVDRSDRSESLRRSFYLDRQEQKGSDVVVNCKRITGFTVLQKNRR
jgi:hypothetical protein